MARALMTVSCEMSIAQRVRLIAEREKEGSESAVILDALREYLERYDGKQEKPSLRTAAHDRR